MKQGKGMMEGECGERGWEKRRDDNAILNSYFIVKELRVLG